MLLGIILSVVLHEAVMESVYADSKTFWRPGFLGAEETEGLWVFWGWLIHKCVFALSVGVLYALCRENLHVRPWRKGVYVGLLSWLMIAATYLGLATALALPVSIWISWMIDYFVSAVLAGGAMGSMVERFADSSG